MVRPADDAMGCLAADAAMGCLAAGWTVAGAAPVDAAAAVAGWPAVCATPVAGDAGSAGCAAAVAGHAGSPGCASEVGAADAGAEDRGAGRRRDVKDGHTQPRRCRRWRRRLSLPAWLVPQGSFWPARAEGGGADRVPAIGPEAPGGAREAAGRGEVAHAALVAAEGGVIGPLAAAVGP